VSVMGKGRTAFCRQFRGNWRLLIGLPSLHPAPSYGTALARRGAKWATASVPLAGKEKKNFTPAIYLLEGLLKKWLAGDAGPALRRGRAGPPLVAGAGRARAEVLPI